MTKNKPTRQRPLPLFTGNFQAYVDAFCTRGKIPHRWLAARMQLSRGAFSEIYHGTNRDPRLSTCLRITEALGIPLEALTLQNPSLRLKYIALIDTAKIQGKP